MPKTLTMIDPRPNGSGGHYERGKTYTLADDIADYFLSIGVARYPTLQQSDVIAGRDPSTGAVSTIGTGRDPLGAPVVAVTGPGGVVRLSAGGADIDYQRGLMEMGLEGRFDAYVDATLGSDANDGESLHTAWATLSKMNTMGLAPGEKRRVLVRKGTYSTALDYIFFDYSSADGAQIELVFEPGCIMDGTLANPAADSFVNGVEARGASAWTLTIYGNGVIIRNFHDTSLDSSPNGIGGRGSAIIVAHDCHCIACDDGFSAHQSCKIYAYRCTARDCEKSPHAHVDASYFEAWDCAFFGGGTLGLGGVNTDDARMKLVRCDLIPENSGEELRIYGSELIDCRIGTWTKSVTLFNSATNTAVGVIRDSWINLVAPGNVFARMERCFGKYSTEIKAGGDVTFTRGVIVESATGKTPVIVGNVVQGCGKNEISYSAIKDDVAFSVITSSVTPLMVAAGVKLWDNLLHTGLIMDPDLVAADTAGTVIQRTLYGDAGLVGPSGRYTQSSYYVTHAAAVAAGIGFSARDF